MPRIRPDSLLEFSTELLAAGGFRESEACATAELLVWANMRGVHSHGVLRIPRYLEMVEQGTIQPGGNINVVLARESVCVLDAGRAPAAVAMNRAVQQALSISDDQGIGWCAVRKTTHAGAIGYFVEQIANRGKIGVVATASRPLMNYFGAKGAALSTNPLALGIPRSDGYNPIIFDMSTAAVALGKIMAAKDTGSSIPLGWGVDEDGRDTTDPHAVASVLPVGGPKGSGLSLMLEILCSLLINNANLAPVLRGGKPGGFNGMVLVIDPSFFGEQAQFIENVEALATAILALDPVEGTEKVLLPGDRGYQSYRDSAANGVNVPSGTVSRLTACANTLRVNLPSEFEREQI